MKEPPGLTTEAVFTWQTGVCATSTVSQMILVVDTFYSVTLPSRDHQHTQINFDLSLVWILPRINTRAFTLFTMESIYPPVFLPSVIAHIIQLHIHPPPCLSTISECYGPRNLGKSACVQISDLTGGEAWTTWMKILHRKSLRSDILEAVVPTGVASMPIF